MDLKNRKQELSDVLAQLAGAGSYDELISLSQKVMALAIELKVTEQMEAQIDAKIKESIAQETTQLKELIKQIPVQQAEAPKAVESIEEVPVFVAPIQEKKEDIVAVKTTPVPTVRAASLSEKLQTADISIAARMSKSSIKDLTKAVSINQKILFTKELFKGDSFAFNEAIGKLNAFENKEAAMTFLNVELSPKFSFKLESESYLQFVELIERRYA